MRLLLVKYFRTQIAQKLLIAIICVFANVGYSQAPNPCDDCTVSPEDAGYLYVGDIYGSVAGPGIFDDYFAASNACQYDRGCLTIPVEDNLWVIGILGASLLIGLRVFNTYKKRNKLAQSTR